MSTQKHHIDGELYLSLETVAELYHVKVVVLRQAYELGLLGAGDTSGDALCIAAVQLDRVATIVRLHCVLGLDIETVALTID